ncbi:SPFH domain-containing protein [Bacillus spizizenii]|nr:SPFH domain-containing protein [Bacillus spizizenii]
MMGRYFGDETKPAVKRNKRKHFMIGGGIVAAILIMGIVVLWNSVYKVTPGYNGIVYSMNGGLEKKPLGQGYKLLAPWKSVTEYPVSTETVYLIKDKEGKFDDSIQVNTGDGKSVNVDVVYAYKMDPEKLPHVFTKFRRQSAEQIAETYIKQEVLNQVQNLTRKESVLGVYSQNTDKIISEARSQLTDLLGKDGIILERFTISDVRPDETTLATLQEIADAQNKQEHLKREEKNKEQEAVNNKIEAEGAKEVALIKAKETAEAEKIKASGKAEANDMLQKSITQQLIDYEVASKWNGELPKVSGGSSIVNLPEKLLGGEAKDKK